MSARSVKQFLAWQVTLFVQRAARQLLLWRERREKSANYFRRDYSVEFRGDYDGDSFESQKPNLLPLIGLNWS